MVQLSTGIATTLSATLLVCAEVLGVAAVAVMGKSGFAYIKARVFTFFRQYGLPTEVSRSRYNIGLVIFTLPVLFGWIAVYIAE